MSKMHVLVRKLTGSIERKSRPPGHSLLECLDGRLFRLFFITLQHSGSPTKKPVAFCRMGDFTKKEDAICRKYH